MANAYQKTIFLSSATLFALAAAPPAFAQNAATGGTKGVDSSDTEIIITAQKREERLVDVPISLTALTGDQLAAAGVTQFHDRSEEHTSELQSLMRSSYAVFCLKKKKIKDSINTQMTYNT